MSIRCLKGVKKEASCLGRIYEAGLPLLVEIESLEGGFRAYFEMSGSGLRRLHMHHSRREP